MDKSFFERGSLGIILVLISTILISFAQITFKMVWSDTNDWSSLASKIVLGFGLYGLGAVLFLLALRKRKVSYLFPFLTLSYVWVIFLSAYLFGEEISVGKILGVSLILTGILLIYAGGKGKND